MTLKVPIVTVSSTPVERTHHGITSQENRLHRSRRNRTDGRRGRHRLRSVRQLGRLRCDHGRHHRDEHGRRWRRGPDVTSSITVADSENVDESTEATQLAALAKVTADEAGAAATAAVPGTVTGIRLENEDGSVVYTVEVSTTTGTVDVTVDAGTGAVLAQEADSADGDGGHDYGGGDGDGDHGGGDGDGDGGHDGHHSNTDAAHEASESPERAAEEAKADAQIDSTTTVAP